MFLTCEACGKTYDRQDGHEICPADDPPELPDLYEPLQRIAAALERIAPALEALAASKIEGSRQG